MRALLERLYLEQDRCLVELDQAGFLCTLTLDHRTIRVDGSVLAYSHYCRPEVWCRIRMGGVRQTSQFAELVRLVNNRAWTEVRTYGRATIDGVSYDVAGRCRDELIWNGVQWQNQLRVKLWQEISHEGRVLRRQEVAPEVLREVPSAPPANAPSFVPAQVG